VKTLHAENICKLVCGNHCSSSARDFKINNTQRNRSKEDLAYTKGYFPWLLCRRICQGLTIGVSAWTFDAKIKGFSYCNLFFWKLKSTPFRCYWICSLLLFFIRWLFAMGGTIFYLCLFFFSDSKPICYSATLLSKSYSNFAVYFFYWPIR
jgi:hypothetical protein